jgi:hypothetical protein
MTRIKKNVLCALFMAGVFTVSARAATFTTATCNAADVLSTISSASNGDTVNVPSGSCTWSTGVTITKGITFQGQTVCTGSGDPNGGTSGVVSCADSTSITLNAGASLVINPASGQLITVNGFTLITNIASNAAINIKGNHGQVGFRFHHNHVEMTYAGAETIFSYNGYGLIDHNYFQDAVASGLGGVPLDFGGDYSTYGYQNWNDAMNFGSNQAIYAEQNYYTTTHPNTEGFFDAYYGAKLVVRFNTIVGNEVGGWHGTDSGFPFRSVVLGEVYGNAVTQVAGSFGIMNTRGGSLLFWNNAVGGTNAGGIDLQYYRYGEQNPYSAQWGTAGAGLNWIIPNANNPSNWTPLTLNAPDFAPSQSDAALAVVGPLSNNAGTFNFQLTNGPCISGTYPGSWNQTWGATTTDSGGCIWQNVGGTTAASSLSMPGWCAANPDTMAASNSVCSALAPGDTASRYFDSGGYPFRDQPGRVHNQVLAPNYEWGNSGVALPTTLFGTDSATSSIIRANVDYYNHAASFTGASGTGTGPLESIPPTCTQGVGYFAIDQGSWNVSGNGSGQGVLYQCVSTNTWAAYYAPYTYPYPLGEESGPAPPTNPQVTVQ